MKIPKLLLYIGFLVGIFFSCADYDLMEQSLHPDGVTLSITGVSDTSVTIRWTRYTGEDFQRYSVYCSRSDAIDTTDSLCDTLLFSIDTAKTIRGLMVGTLYYFRVMVTTKEGGVGVSNIVDTTTVVSMKGKLKLEQPDTAALTDSTVTLRWSSCVSLFDSYKIYRDTTSNADDKDTLIRTVYNDTQATIRGLDQSRDYWFRVYAVLDTTVVAVSNVMQAATTTNVRKAQIKLFGPDIVTDSLVHLRWTKCNFEVDAYRIFKGSTALIDTLDSIVAIKNNAADTTAVIKELSGSTTYWFRVFARKAGVYVASSNPIEVLTGNY
jgi:hypothetical protein